MIDYCCIRTGSSIDSLCLGLAVWPSRVSAQNRCLNNRECIIFCSGCFFENVYPLVTSDLASSGQEVFDSVGSFSDELLRIERVSWFWKIGKRWQENLSLGYSKFRYQILMVNFIAIESHAETNDQKGLPKERKCRGLFVIGVAMKWGCLNQDERVEEVSIGFRALRLGDKSSSPWMI